MSNDNGILSVYLGTSLKEQWCNHCARQGVRPTTAVRQVVQKLVSKSVSPFPQKLMEHETPDPIRRRLELRLTGSEYSAICERAERLVVSPNIWTVDLIRANLTGSAQLGFAELEQLGRSNSNLLAIGRNLNQIARWMNSNKGSAAPELERIEKLYRLIVLHTEGVTAIMRANIDRWVLK